jgi:hypothetical protein
MNERNPYAPPQADVDPVAPATAVSPPLWNPNAAASWSLLFTPVFGAILHMKNWEALGEPQKAAGARSWAIGTVIFLFALAIVSGILGDSKALDSLSRIAGLVVLVAWYYASGKSQQNYVLARFGKNYPRRGWAKPLLFALLAVVGFVVVLGVIGFVIGWVAGA